jgi:hypothetical protein
MGKRPDRLVFDQHYYLQKKTPIAPVHDHPLEVKNRVLLFTAFDQRIGDLPLRELIFWINLSQPDAADAGHPAFDNDGKWLGDAEKILALVKAHIAKEDVKDRKKLRGLIVAFPGGGKVPGVDRMLVRTADSDYKQVLIKQLSDADDQVRKMAIYNLISYPSQETVNLMAPFLTEVTKIRIQRTFRLNGVDVPITTTTYPLRQMAYVALKLIGESPKKPQGYDPDYFLWECYHGFENERIFPNGDWKKLKPFDKFP